MASARQPPRGVWITAGLVCAALALNGLRAQAQPALTTPLPWYVHAAVIAGALLCLAGALKRGATWEWRIFWIAACVVLALSGLASANWIEQRWATGLYEAADITAAAAAFRCAQRRAA